MHQQGDDAGQCRSGLSARDYPDATAADRAIYRKWMLGMVVFYSTLLVISGVVAIVTESNSGLTRLTSLSAQPMSASRGSH